MEYRLSFAYFFSDFQWFFDAVHGNCYVFNSAWHNSSKQFVATEVGKRNGNYCNLLCPANIWQKSPFVIYLHELSKSAENVTLMT